MLNSNFYYHFYNARIKGVLHTFCYFRHIRIIIFTAQYKSTYSYFFISSYCYSDCWLNSSLVILNKYLKNYSSRYCSLNAYTTPLGISFEFFDFKESCSNLVITSLKYLLVFSFYGSE